MGLTRGQLWTEQWIPAKSGQCSMSLCPGILLQRPWSANFTTQGAQERHVEFLDAGRLYDAGMLRGVVTLYRGLGGSRQHLAIGIHLRRTVAAMQPLNARRQPPVAAPGLSLVSGALRGAWISIYILASGQTEAITMELKCDTTTCSRMRGGNAMSGPLPS